MNSKKAKLLRKKAREFSTEKSEYKEIPMNPSNKVVSRRMSAFRAGLIENTEEIGEPSIRLEIDKKCERYYYKVLKDKEKINAKV